MELFKIILLCISIYFFFAWGIIPLFKLVIQFIKKYLNQKLKKTNIKFSMKQFQLC